MDPDTGSNGATDAAPQTEVEALAEFEAGILRKPGHFWRVSITLIAIAWSLFQIAVAAGDLVFEKRLDSIRVRSIHLGFAMLLLFLNYPLFRKPRFGIKAWADMRRLPWWDIFCAVAGCLAALYLAIDYEGLARRQGQPLVRDIVIGVVLVVLLLEASRRVIGPALAVIALVFTVYVFTSEYMPEFIFDKNVSLYRYVEQMTLWDAGVYGVPLDVSAKVVFLFVLFGSMLDRAGGGRFFIDLALSLVGRYRGGPAKAAVLSSGLTGMISGSSIANIVTTGTFTIPLMKKVGYPAKKAAAIEVAASTDGQLAPPIMGAAAFIIAEYINVPYLEVVKAAIIPAMVSYATLLYITHLEACKLGLMGMAKENLKSFTTVLFQGFHFLIPLGVLLYFLIIQRRSPEPSVFHAIWILAIVMVARRIWQALQMSQADAAPMRETGFSMAASAGHKVTRGVAAGVVMGLRDVLDGLASGARNMVSVALACAAAGIVVGIGDMGLAGTITDIIGNLSRGNIFLLLLITAVASLIIGMGLPTTATYVVVGSLIATVIVDVGGAHGFAVPLMAAHLFCFYFGILADDTPPVGLAAYAAAAIAKSPPIATGVQAFLYDIRTAILPFMFIFNTDLILHKVTRWDHGILIFVTACLGSFAFAAATQGWFLRRNRWYELPFFLVATLVLMRPDLIAQWLGIDYSQRYWTSLIGIGIIACLWTIQRIRRQPPTQL